MQQNNNYKLNIPIDKKGNIRKYVEYVKYLAKVKEEKTKKEILEATGVDINKIVLRGFASKPFTLLKNKKILSYNKSNKKWKIGENGATFLKDIEERLETKQY